MPNLLALRRSGPGWWRPVLGLAACLSLLSLWVSAQVLGADPIDAARRESPTGAGAVLRHGHPPPPGLGGALDFVDHTGRPFSLDRLAGQPALLFFGFTRCSDRCPPAWVTAREVLDGLGTGPGAGPQILFVTLDPLSDRPAELARVIAEVAPGLIGLTGTPEQVERAVERYGVGVQGAAPALAHSAVWYLLDGHGALRRVYAHSTTAAQLLADLRALRTH